MKKNLLVALLVAFITLPASAQNFRWGVEAGLNFNKISVSALTNAMDAKAGFFIGPKVQFNLPLVGLIVDGSLQYSQSGIKTVDDNTMTLPYIVLPINIKYALGLGSVVSLYLSTGPQFNLYVGSTSTYEYGLLAEEIAPKRTSFNWNVGLGAHILSHFQVGVTYSIGLGNTMTISDLSFGGIASEAFTGKNNIWQVRLAYMF